MIHCRFLFLGCLMLQAASPASAEIRSIEPPSSLPGTTWPNAVAQQLRIASQNPYLPNDANTLLIQEQTRVMEMQDKVFNTLIFIIKLQAAEIVKLNALRETTR